MKLKDCYLKLVKEAKKDHIPETDIRYLFSYYQKYDDISSFYLKLDDEVINYKSIENAYQKMKSGYPVAYITNSTDFLSSKYIVKEGVLIPRVETEELLALTIRNIEIYLKDKPLTILDVGTGSGVLAIELMKRYQCKVDATDISNKALNIAKLNNKKHKTSVKFYQVDTYPNNKNKYNVIISNPPYIKFKKDVDKDVLDYEPHEALFINKDNDVYEKIFKEISKRTLRPCLIAFEIAPNIVNHLNKLMAKYLLALKSHFIYSKDINNKERFLTIIIE